MSLQPSQSDTLRSILVELQKSGEVSPQIEFGDHIESMTLESLGLDSVGRMTLLAAIEVRTGMFLDAHDFTDDMTVGELERTIQGKMAP
jgi:acyl carrier protein